MVFWWNHLISSQKKHLGTFCLDRCAELCRPTVHLWRSRRPFRLAEPSAVSVTETSIAQVLIQGDGSLVTWGAGSSTSQPPCVQQVALSETACAAVREAGDVVTWGEAKQCDTHLATWTKMH